MRGVEPTGFVALTVFWLGVASAVGQITDDTPAVPDQPVHVRVHAGELQKEAIPSTIFGSFLEPIGHSTYGGLWSELLENGSFEEGLWSAGAIARMIKERPELERASKLDLPLPWEPLDVRQGNRYEPQSGDAPNSSNSLLIMGLPAGEVGIRQRIYLPVHRILSIAEASLSSISPDRRRCTSRFATETIVQAALAETTMDAAAKEWTKYSFELTVKPGTVGRLQPVDFVVALHDDARAYIDQVSLMPADAVDGMDPEVVQWRERWKPTGPVWWQLYVFLSLEERHRTARSAQKPIQPCMEHAGVQHFGTDEFLRFCELIGAQPQIALNLGSGTPEEAAEWVKYVNDRWGDKKGGLLWELGNELWGSWNTGYPAQDQIGVRTQAFSEAIRKVDPNARLIATGADPDHYHDWNALQLATPPGTFQYLSTHFVVRDDQVQLANPSDDFIALSSFALPIGLEQHLKEMTEQIQQSNHKNAKIAFTEWLFVPGQRPAPGFDNMGGAIETAGFLNMLLRNSSIVPISDMTGILEFGGIWKKREQVYGAPGYWVLRSYAEEKPSRLVATESDAPMYTVEEGVNRLPHIDQFPWLEVVAAMGPSPDTLVLFCVNRSLTRDFRAVIQMDGFTPRTLAQAKTISAPSIYTENNEMQPHAVGNVTNQIRVGSTFETVFPHSSVVVIRLLRKSN